MFYPSDPYELRAEIRQFLDAVPAPLQRGAEAKVVAPKALIAPHAGYRYSGPVAASAYAALAKAGGRVERVVLFGPAHHVAIRGLATSSADAFETPMGDVPVDRAALSTLVDLPVVQIHDEAHAPEHGLEVHLPFLCAVLGAAEPPGTENPFAFVPLLFGQVDDMQAAEVLDRLWGGAETLIVISSDLSHYLDYETATRLDRETAGAIVDGRAKALGPRRACGHVAIQALMRIARQRGLSAECVDLRNSGDTAGPRNEVVGYGAFIFT